MQTPLTLLPSALTIRGTVGLERFCKVRRQFWHPPPEHRVPHSEMLPEFRAYPYYEAGDTSTVANVSQGINGISGGTHLVQNRDYYGEVSQSAQSSSTVPFDGLHGGTGYGTLLRRPSSCTTGVAYWATDQGTWNNGGTGGVLYKCTSTNIWSLLYTPYTYPHPLINSVASGR